MRLRGERQDRYLVRWAVAAALVAMLLAVAAAEAAQPTSLVIELDKTVHGPAGSWHLVAGPVQVQAEPGWLCGVAAARTANNSSPHDGTNLRVKSGASQVQLADIEATAWQGAAVGGLVIDGPVTVWIQLGGDGVASLGFVVTVACSQPAAPTPTTLPPAGTTTTAAPTSTATTVAPPTGSTVPVPVGVDTGRAPEGGVAAGGGSTVNGQDPAILLWGGGVALVMGAVLGIAALAPRLRGRKGPDDGK